MTYHPAAAAFEGVADLIGNGAPPAFLATVLAEAAGGISLAAREEQRLPSAEELRDRLEQVKKASRVLARYLADPNTVGRLDRASQQPSDRMEPVDLSGKADWLQNLARRSDAAKAAVKAQDGEKAWPTPEGLMADQLCALVVARLWHAVRSKPAGPQSGKVARACDAMWEACGQEPLGVDEGIWRRRLELARKLLDDSALAAGMPVNSPERQLHQRAVAFCEGQARRLVELEEQQARRERVVRVREQMEQEQAAQLRTKH